MTVTFQLLTRDNLKAHRQLALMRIRYHFIANLHIAETRSILVLTKYDENNIIGWAKAHSKTGFSVNNWKSSKTLQRLKRNSRCTLISRLRVVPLSLSPLSETRKKPAREKRGRVRSCISPPRSHGHFFLAGFLRVSQDGLSERGTTRSLFDFRLRWTIFKGRKLMSRPLWSQCPFKHWMDMDL